MHHLVHRSRKGRILGFVALILPGLFTSIGAQAHATDIATYVVIERQGVWVVQVSLASAGLSRALSKRLGKPSGDLTEAAYKQATVDAIRGGLHLVVDGKPARLGGGGVKLGGHQTDLLFALPDLATAPTSLLGSRIDGLREISNQHNVLRLVRGELRAQWILARRNGFTLTEDVPASVGSDDLQHTHGSSWQVGVGILAGLGVLLTIGVLLRPHPAASADVRACK